MKKVLRIFGIVVLIGVFGGTMYFLYNKSKKKPDVFETRAPFVSNVIMKTVATGSVVPRFEIEIKPQVSGIIDELYVLAGDRIAKGQVIARIKIIPDMVNLNSAETRLNRAKISFEDAQIDYDRQQKLFDKSVISYADYKTAKVNYDSSKEELMQELEEATSQQEMQYGGFPNTTARGPLERLSPGIPRPLYMPPIPQKANIINAAYLLSDSIGELFGKAD